MGCNDDRRETRNERRWHVRSASRMGMHANPNPNVNIHQCSSTPNHAQSLEIRARTHRHRAPRHVNMPTPHRGHSTTTESAVTQGRKCDPARVPVRNTYTDVFSHSHFAFRAGLARRRNTDSRQSVVLALSGSQCSDASAWERDLTVDLAGVRAS